MPSLRMEYLMTLYIVPLLKVSVLSMNNMPCRMYQDKKMPLIVEYFCAGSVKQ